MIVIVDVIVIVIDFIFYPAGYYTYSFHVERSPPDFILVQWAKSGVV